MNEQDLWGNVLLRGVIDAIWPRPGANACTGVSTLQQQQARTWLGSRDFHAVCSLAGMDADFILDRITPLIEGPEADREAFILRALGNQGRRTRPHVSDDAKATFRRMFEAGATFPEIGRALGVTRKVAAAMAKREGYEPRRAA